MSTDAQPADSPAPARGDGRLARFFLLRSTLEEARQRGFTASDQGWAEYLWARSAYDAADRFREVAGDPRATVLLLEQSVWLTAVATAKRANGSEANLDADALFQVMAGSESLGATAGALSDTDRLRLQRILSERCASVSTATAESSSRELRAQIQWLRPLARRLIAGIDRDADATRRVERRRIARIGGAALLVAAFVGAVIYVLVRALTPEPANYALNKPVTCSSEQNPKQFPRQALVDGNTSSAGAATRRQPNPWVRIDLGRPTTVRQVVVYNAASSKNQALGLPLALEASPNGKKWKRLGLQKKPFSVWEFVPKKPPKPARYIRLRVRSRRAQLRLGEVVVH